MPFPFRSVALSYARRQCRQPQQLSAMRRRRRLLSTTATPTPTTTHHPITSGGSRTNHSNNNNNNHRPMHTTTPLSSNIPAAISSYGTGEEEDDHDGEGDIRSEEDVQSSWDTPLLQQATATPMSPTFDDCWDNNPFQGDGDEDDDSYCHGPVDRIARRSADRKLNPDYFMSTTEMVNSFDPKHPPSSDKSLEEMQLWYECLAQHETALRYRKTLDAARDRKDYSSLSKVQRHIAEWYGPLKELIEEKQLEHMTVSSRGGGKIYGFEKYGPKLCALPAEKLAVICAHEAVVYCLENSKKDKFDGSFSGVSLPSIARHLGECVESELNVQRYILMDSMKQRRKKMDPESLDLFVEDEEDYVTKETKELSKWMYGAHHLERFKREVLKMKTKDSDNKALSRRVAKASRLAREQLDSTDQWSIATCLHIGCALLDLLMKVATVGGDDNKAPAFVYDKHFKFGKIKAQGHVKINDNFYNMVMNDSVSYKLPHTSRFKPMVVPPTPWQGDAHKSSAYKWLRCTVMRTRDSRIQQDVLTHAELSTVYDGLNTLGKVPWKINRKVLDVARTCWRDNIPIGEIPPRDDFEVPPAPEPSQTMAPVEVWSDENHPDYQESMDQRKEYVDKLLRHERAIQRNMDLNSLRCSVILKLDQAESFKEFENIYFPYNLDFRGRAYPVPPHLSNTGSDLCRGMLRFSEAKPLGEKGLYWLKVHLANLAGNDKITFDDRANFADVNMQNIRAAVNDPLGENRWWMDLEDPFQALAVCHEIVNAIDSGDPTTYESDIPVHMDGSCNGLQHYAALGRDLVGGSSVNLVPADLPQDVYSGVMEKVAKRISDEAAIDLDYDMSTDDLTAYQKKRLRENNAAKLVDGLIDRGVVKRTVMTSVYGVTFIGARDQIKEKIEGKLKNKGVDIDEREKAKEIMSACNILAKITLDVMGELFVGARETMTWLGKCSKLIAAHDHPVAWITPLGLPVVQPYRRTNTMQILTLFQAITIHYDFDDLPVDKQKQTSAFPPNYIHSLDSTHMMLTALEMEKRGLTFSAVHDSFWTHPCDVDEMNEILRDSFVDLYEQPILEDLKKTWELRYPNVEFPPVPKQGELDLSAVKKSPYFFQ